VLGSSKFIEDLGVEFGRVKKTNQQTQQKKEEHRRPVIVEEDLLNESPKRGYINGGGGLTIEGRRKRMSVVQVKREGLIDSASKGRKKKS